MPYLSFGANVTAALVYLVYLVAIFVVNDACFAAEVFAFRSIPSSISDISRNVFGFKKPFFQPPEHKLLLVFENKKQEGWTPSVGGTCRPVLTSAHKWFCC